MHLFVLQPVLPGLGDPFSSGSGGGAGSGPGDGGADFLRPAHATVEDTIEVGVVLDSWGFGGCMVGKWAEMWCVWMYLCVVRVCVIVCVCVDVCGHVCACVCEKGVV